MDCMKWVVVGEGDSRCKFHKFHSLYFFQRYFLPEDMKTYLDTFHNPLGLRRQRLRRQRPGQQVVRHAW